MKDKLDVYAMIIYVFYYVLVLSELVLFSFADTSVLPHADDPQVCVILYVTCNVSFIPDIRC